MFHVGPGFFRRDIVQGLFLRCPEADGDVFDGCQDDQVVGVKVFGQEFADKVFVDDGTGASQVIALVDDGDAAAATGDDQLP